MLGAASSSAGGAAAASARGWVRSQNRVSACEPRPDVEQHLRCRKLRAWVVRWVANDANYARMVRYDVYHKLRRLRG